MEELRRLRRLKGLTQQELAERAKVSQYTITEIETGRREPRPSTLRKLAKALGVEVADLFREPEAPKAPSAPRSLDELCDILEAQLGSAWIALPEEEWSNWWRGVSREEATKRFRQILAESKFIRSTWKTREDIMVLAKSDINMLRIARRLEAPFFAPQQYESEEEFQERSAAGRPIDQYYEPIFQEHRQDLEREAKEEEERRLTVA